MSYRPLLTLLALAACTLRPYDYLAGDTTTGSTAGTSGTTSGTWSATTATTAESPTTTTGTGTTTTDALTGSTSSSTTVSFIPVPDSGGTPFECDIWVENCPEGQKCMPYSGDGDNAWESLKCSAVDPDPDDVGEPCTVVGSGVSGEDSCVEHAMCWDVDPDTGMGVCIAFCTGSPDAPMCEDGVTACTVGRTFAICLPGCDPILQDCAGDDLCVPHPQDPNSFLCVLDASGEEGQTHDPCEYANACDPGLFCLGPELAGECDPMAAGCCIPVCDTSLPNTCAGQGTECLAWYEPGMAPPGYENVGVCGLPQ